jgi:hypothetical protein
MDEVLSMWNLMSYDFCEWFLGKLLPLIIMYRKLVHGIRWRVIKLICWANRSARTKRSRFTSNKECTRQRFIVYCREDGTQLTVYEQIIMGIPLYGKHPLSRPSVR